MEPTEEIRHYFKEIGSRGGAAGVGASKTRSKACYRKAAAARWAKWRAAKEELDKRKPVA